MIAKEMHFVKIHANDWLLIKKDAFCSQVVQLHYLPAGANWNVLTSQTMIYWLLFCLYLGVHVMTGCWSCEVDVRGMQV